MRPKKKADKRLQARRADYAAMAKVLQPDKLRAYKQPGSNKK